MKVFITDAAVRDLMAIADHIRPDNPERAATFVSELLDRCESLAELSARFPLVRATKGTGFVVAFTATTSSFIESDPSKSRCFIS